MLVAGLLAAICAASLVGTAFVRRYALARSVLDVPNARSSHVTPTPRGGGVAIVVAFTVGVLVFASLGWLTTSAAVGLVGSGLGVALVGFIDDHRHVPPRWRLLTHFVAAVWGLVWLGGIEFGDVSWLPHEAGLILQGVAVVALVWLLNLYNFMDGIDGIAGVEGVTAAAGMVLITAITGHGRLEWALPAALAASVLGFLAWNFPPAKIFMGDAGSGFVGLMLGLLAAMSSAVAPVLLWCWAILLAVFVVDATVTLMIRMSRGQRLSEAHRSHAYQHAAAMVGSHRLVTSIVGLINTLWLFPIALLVARGTLSGLGGVLLAYTPLCLVALRYKAGRADPGSPRAAGAG